MARNSSRIPYNKKININKQLGSSGPRDNQRRQQLKSGAANINMPKTDINELKRVLLSNPKIRDELKREIKADMDDAAVDVKRALREEVKNIESSSGLPFDVVQQKISDAVKHTKEQEEKKYKSIIEGLNGNISYINEKINKEKSEITNKTIETDRLIMKINVLEKELDNKNEALKQSALELQLSEKERRESVQDLRTKITEMLEKIMAGEITVRGREFKDEEGRSRRPTLEDVFIDPLEELSTELDVHIQIDEFKPDESEGPKRDIKADVEKLKNLLNKNKK